MKVVPPWLVLWARRTGRRDFYPALAALVSHAQNIFSSPHTFSLYVSPTPSNPGRQSCWASVSGTNSKNAKTTVKIVVYIVIPL
jgi:hypothetical protein